MPERRSEGIMQLINILNMKSTDLEFEKQNWLSVHVATGLNVCSICCWNVGGLMEENKVKDCV